MSSSSGVSPTIPLQSLDALQASRPAAPDSGNGATVAFQKTPDTASRVLNQLEGLTKTLEQATSKESKASAAGEHGDEECLESYLQRYMQQLTGKKQESAGAATSAAVKDTPVEAVAPEV